MSVIMLVKSDTDSRKLSKVSHNTTLKQNVNTKYETVTNQRKYASSKLRVIQLLGNPIHADNTVGAIKNRESTLVPSSRGKGMKAKYLKEV